MHAPKVFGRLARTSLVCLVALSYPSESQSQGTTARSPTQDAVWLVEARGRVEVLHAERRRAARPAEPLVSADRVQTWTNSHANLLWYGHMDFQISELSDITIPPPPSAAPKSGVVEVLKGLLYFYHRGKPRQVEIKTPTAAAIVLGTEFAVRVEPTGRTVLLLFDGSVAVTNALGGAKMVGGQQATIDPGQAPVVTPILEALNDLIQWFLYYPAVLNLDEAGFTPAEQNVLATSLAAYRAGNLSGALAAYPPGRAPASPSERIYFAALLLSVGQVDKAQAMLDTIQSTDEPAASLATALRKLIATVKGRSDDRALNPRLSTAWLVESYYQQSRANLAGALAAATHAIALAPQFGPGWARAAELEFSFGRTVRALKKVERALELSLQNAQALTLKGFLLAAQNRVPAAEKYFERAIAVDGGLGNAWLGKGLCRIRSGAAAAGREDLLVAAAVEPQRSVLRSYLGKALADAGLSAPAAHELELARSLDPRDPTGPFYAALLSEQENQINQAIRDLESSQDLNENRRLYRSRFLLDQDRAVRSANLARIYDDAGMSDVSVREAARAVNYDYANYSAHLFLANSYNLLTDPKGVDVRYEAAAFSEYLVASLLAPVGAGTLSPAISQQEYSRLFESDGPHLSSTTEYLSRGAWHETAAQYGLFGRTSYSLESDYLSDPGQRPNNDFTRLTLSLQVRQQLTPADSVYFQVGEQRSRGGDVAQHYDPARAFPDYRFHDTQEPVLLAGWHREWGPGNHTLFIGGYYKDDFETSTTNQPVAALFTFNGEAYVPVPFYSPASLQYRNQLDGYYTELQQIWERPHFSLIAGARYQTERLNTHTTQGASADFVVPTTSGASLNLGGAPAGVTNIESRLNRVGGYAYANVQPFDSLLLSAGVSYEWLKFPANYFSAPISAETRLTDKLSPKAGFIWQPGPRTILRGAYTRSLGGATFEQSYRLEPSQVTGFNQTLRSLAPESVAGLNLAPSFETFGVSAERRFGVGTYAAITAEFAREKFRRDAGLEEFFFAGTGFASQPSLVTQRLKYEEPSLTATFNQLLGENVSIGVQYRISLAELTTQYPDLVIPALTQTNFQTTVKRQAILQHLQLAALFNHPSGFFAQARAQWYSQDSRRADAGLADANFWQFDVLAGWRLWQRHVEARVGVLNLTGRNYRLNPLNLVPELPRQRTLTASLKFNF